MLSYVQARTPRGERCSRHGSARTHGRDDSSAACASSVAASTEWAVCRRCCRRGRAALRFGASEKEHRQESQHGPPGKKRREANIAADLSPCLANSSCCRRRVRPFSLYGRQRGAERALCRRKLRKGRNSDNVTASRVEHVSIPVPAERQVHHWPVRVAPVGTCGRKEQGATCGMARPQCALPPVPSTGSAEAGRGGRGAGCSVLRR